MDLLYDLSRYAIIGIITLLIIIAIYLKLYKGNKIKMQEFYGFGAKLSDKDKIQHLIKNAIEIFIRKLLKYPGFDFDNPVYFDKNNKIISMKDENKEDEEDEEDESSPSAPITLSEPDKNVPKDEDDKITYDDMKLVLYNDLSTNKVFMGMTEDSLKNLGIAIGIQVLGSIVAGLGKQAKIALKKSLQTGGSKVFTSLARKIGLDVIKQGSEKAAQISLNVATKSSARVMKTVIAKLGTAIAMKFGYYSSKSIASKAVSKFVNTILNEAVKKAVKSGGAFAAKVAGKMAAITAKISAKAGMGPVGWVLLAFDIISLSLDLADVGGYSNLETAKEIRDETNKINQAQYEKIRSLKIQYPANIGPLDKYIWNDNIDYADRLRIAQIDIINRDPYYKEMVKDMLLPDEILSYDKSSANEMKLENILLTLNQTDSKKLEIQAIKEMCIPAKGEFKNDICEYPNSFNTEISRRMSIELDPKGKWMKPILDENAKWLESNPNSTADNIKQNLKKLFEKHLSKEVQDKISNKIMNEWCTSEGGKMLLDGTTCTYNNSESCVNHYNHEDGKTKRKYSKWDSVKNKCVEADIKIEKACIDAKLKYNTNNGLCEMDEPFCTRKGGKWDPVKLDCKIPPGQEIAEFIFGTTIVRGLNQVFDTRQYKSCPPGTSDIGYACTKPESGIPNCGEMYGSGWRNQGTKCTNQLDTIPADCPSGYYNSGLTCTKKLYGIGFGVTSDKLKNTSCPSSHPYKRGEPGADWCDDGWVSSTATVDSWKPQNELSYSRSLGNAIPDPGEGKREWEKCGALYYPKCPNGMNFDYPSCNTCVVNGTTNPYFGCNAADWFLDGVRCVKGLKDSSGNWYKSPSQTIDYKCPDGYSSYLGKCRLNCPPGFRDDGLLCWKPREVEYSTKDN